MSNVKSLLENNANNAAQQQRINPCNGTPNEPLCDVQESLSALSSRRARLPEWIQKACAYYAQSDYESFTLLLENAILSCSQTYGGYKDDLLKVYILLAAHFVRLACCEVSARCAEWRARLVKLLQNMDELQTISNDIQYLLCRGFALMLLETRLQEAENYFIAALRQQPHNVYALLGRGCLAYNRKDYRAALGYFKSVLLHHPQGPADVRVGIAHCFLKLNSQDAARRFFELALAHNGHCQNALIGMAQLKYIERQRESNYDAINLLCAAFELNGNHPLVLLWLAGFFYYNHNTEKLHLTAGGAIRNTDCLLIQAQANFQIARSFHRDGNYKRAFDFYGNAMKLCPAEFAPPHLGVAQMYVRRGQLDKAEHSLRTLLKLMPQQTEALRMLATLYTEAESSDMLDVAIQLFKKALERSSREDYSIYLSLAHAYERKQLWEQAIDAYKQAMFLSKQQEVPLTWLNNLAVVQLNANLPAAALSTLKKALAAGGKAAHEKQLESNLLTIRFNRARVLEQLQLTEKAEQCHRLLIKDYPPYYNSYIRLAVIAFKRKQVQVAFAYLNEVLKLDDGNVTARTYLGNFYVKQGDVSLGLFNYDMVMHRLERDSVEDSYLNIAVGNATLMQMHIAVAAGNRSLSTELRDKAIIYFKRAMDKNQHNLWAANGIGIALANYGHLHDAQPIFKLIVETSRRCKAAILNTAHIALQLEQHAEAIEIYQQCFKEFLPVNSVETMQLLAKAHLANGQPKEAKQLLQQARRVAPHNTSLLYNLAVVIRQACSDAFSQSLGQLSKLKRAEQELKLAHSCFNYVAQKDEQLRAYATRQAVKCGKLLDNAPEELKRERQLKQQTNRQAEQIETQLESSKKTSINHKSTICSKSVNKGTTHILQHVEKTEQVITETEPAKIMKTKKKKHKSKNTEAKELSNVLQHVEANNEIAETANKETAKTHKRKHKSKEKESKEKEKELTAVVESKKVQPSEKTETVNEVSRKASKRKQKTKELEPEVNSKTKKKKKLMDKTKDN